MEASLTIWLTLVTCVANASTLGTSLGDESPTHCLTWGKWGLTVIGA